MMESNDQIVDGILQHLIETGAIVLKGLNHQGEPMYVITEKCKDVFPEFYAMHREELNATAYELWAMGLVDIVFGDEDEKVVFSKSHHKKFHELHTQLTSEQKDFLFVLGAPVIYINNDDLF